MVLLEMNEHLGLVYDTHELLWNSIAFSLENIRSENATRMVMQLSYSFMLQ